MQRLPVFVMALVLWGACTLAPDEPPPVGSVESSLGMIKLERAAPESPDLAEGKAMFEAAFARYRGLSAEEVVSLLGGRTVDLEQCILGTFHEGAFDSPDAEVELLDVGDIEIRVSDSRSQVVPRMFPDLAGLVGGAFYADDVMLANAVADEDEYLLRADGGEAAGFETVAVAPAGIAQVLLDGYPTYDGAVVSRELGAELGWDPGGVGDEVEIDLVGRGEVVRCRASDDGAFRVPPEVLSQLPEDEDARIVVRRVRWQLLDAEEFASAWLTLSTTTNLRISLR